MNDPQSSVPVPDPTLLTTQALMREIAGLKELVFSRLDSSDQLTQERFRGVERQFSERDTRTTQSEVASKEAIAAALQAAKEAVGEQAKNFTLSIDKSETATVKQIDAVKQNSETAIAGATSQINDLKERTTRIESLGIGVATQKTESSNSTSLMFAGFGVLVGVSGLVVAAISLAIR